MTRAAIFVTLIAATLVGPCLCCCAMGRLFATSPPTSRTAGAPNSSSTNPACPHCRVPTDEGVGPAAPTPGPAEPTRQCPCCEVEATVVAVAPAPPVYPVVDVPFVGFVPTISDPILPGPAAFPREVYPPGMGVQAFLLDSCHRLRC